MRLAIVVALSVGLLGGCQTVAPGGVVTTGTAEPEWEKGPAVGLKAPQIEFINSEGRTRPLRTSSDWITLISFVASRGSECCFLSPTMTEVASRYWKKPVRVVQVSLPTGKCPHGAGCVEACHVRPLHLMALCDSERTAYNAFGRPKDRTVLLIDGKGKVAGISTIQKIDALLPKADKLAEEAEQKSLPSYLELEL